jgi:4-hydroxyphenylpyruvate dioxygenase
MSKVMSNGNGRIKFPINEPAEGKKNHKSRYLDFMVDQGYNILPSTDDIIKTISQLKARGGNFVCSTSYVLSGDSRTTGRPYENDEGGSK